MKEFEITFRPFGKKALCKTGSTILDAANSLGFVLEGPCGGNGKCGKCKVKIVKFPNNIYQPADIQSNKLLNDTELRKGYRLACTSLVNDDLGVELPPWSWEYAGFDGHLDKNILVTGKVDAFTESRYSLDPAIQVQSCILPKPTIDDNISDLERLRRYLSRRLEVPREQIRLSSSLLNQLSRKLNLYNWRVNTVFVKHLSCIEIIDLLPISVKKIETGEKDNSQMETRTAGERSYYGLAVDLGTSTIAAYLIDLSNNKEVAVWSAVNPQIRIGADVITRIRYASQNNEGNIHLTTLLVETINELIRRICENAKIQPEKIFEIAFVGNPTMLTNLLGIPIDSLGVAPYTPAFNGDHYGPASEVGLEINPHGRFYVGPLVAGFMGADALGTALALGMLDSDDNGGPGKKADIKLALDIGTNGELLLSDGNRLLGCSVAAGPAFEGSNLKYGVRACPGAVYSIELQNRRIKYLTIDNRRALGLTGSAVVDGISEYIRIGVIQPSGNIDQVTGKKWIKYPKRIKLKHATKPTTNCDLILPELKVVPPFESALDTGISITQNDIREIQLAKAAIRTGIELLLTELNLTSSDLDKLYLAGAFGNYIDPQSAINIKLLPEIPLKKITPMGNAAGTGAKILLRSKSARKKVAEVAKSIEYIDLATHPKFKDMFVENMSF